MIINPNKEIINPLKPKQNYVGEIFNTMRIIANYRQSFFDLEACKQNDGVQEPLTATEICRIDDAQQALMQDMVTFILYGDKHDAATRSTKHPAASSADIKKDEKEHAQETPRIIYENGA